MKKFKDITTRKELANSLKIPEKKLNYILYAVGTSSYYKSFEIPKKNGGVRNIHAPTGDLKELQRNLLSLLLDIKEENGSKNKKNISHGFEKGKTIITNAEIHRNKKYVINMDLKDFFESFHFGRVRGYFAKNKNFNLPLDIATIIAQLTCYNGVLPQGAPTSPIIANMICNILDMRLLRIVNKYKLNYTRYADDLTFSTNHKEFLVNEKEFFDEIKYEVENFGLSINDSKTRVLYRESRQEVTGLVVNKVINIKREYYKETRAMANNLYYNGEFLINGEKGSINQLEGRFSFINQLDIYNNKINNVKRNFRKLSYKEKEYQKFLFYKYFIGNDKPLIITEGKTDILYLKSAMMKYSSDYPELIQEKDGKFEYNIMFLKRLKEKEKKENWGKNKYNQKEEDRGRLNYFLGISGHGAATFKNIFDLYNDKTLNIGNFFFNKVKISPKNPVFLVFDNEQKNKKKCNKPLAGFKKYVNIKEEIDILKEIEPYNLYILTNPIKDKIDDKRQETQEAIEAEIEDLFEKSLLEIQINGRSFSREDKVDRYKNFDKNEFSHYVYNNYKNINFENFIPMLDKINKVVNEYKKGELSTCT